MEGTKHDDVIIGTSEDDAINSRSGNDEIETKEGDDFVAAGEGSDTVNAGDGNDIVDLTSDIESYGNVTIDGGASNDTLWSNVHIGTSSHLTVLRYS